MKRLVIMAGAFLIASQAQGAAPEKEPEAAGIAGKENRGVVTPLYGASDILYLTEDQIARRVEEGLARAKPYGQRLEKDKRIRSVEEAKAHFLVAFVRPGTWLPSYLIEEEDCYIFSGFHEKGFVYSVEERKAREERLFRNAMIVRKADGRILRWKDQE